MINLPDEDLRDLKHSTLQVVNYLTFVLVFTIFYLAVAFNNLHMVDFQIKPVWLVANTVLALTAWISQSLLRHHKTELAARLYIGGVLLTINLSLLAPGSLDTFLPYLYLLVIALSGLLITPISAFSTAIIALLSSLPFLVGNYGLTVDLLLKLLPPAALSMMMAVVTWGSAENLTTAFSWAVGSQQRAQMRRDQLFASEQQLQRANALLEATNHQLVAARRLAEEANETKTKFITNLSHELRTPLNAIISFSYILAQSQNGQPGSYQLSEQQRNYLSRIQNAGEHLLGIVNDLLDLAKIEAGQLDLLAEEVDLAAMGGRVIQLTEGLVGSKPVELIMDIPPHLPPLIADATRLQQILVNLLSNAAKYTDQGHIALRVQPGDTEITIAVEDTGIGIKAEDMELIFREFHQTEEALHHKRLGTGLGLPISRKFIEMHGGRIWVDSEIGRGSTFYFSLPLVLQVPAQLPEQLPAKTIPDVLNA